MKIPIAAVIDTSVMISALIFVWIMSQPLYDEYQAKIVAKLPEIIKRAASHGVEHSTESIDALMGYLVEQFRWVDMPPVLGGMTDDENDEHIATLAVETGVNYLVTLDQDFNPMKKGRYTVEIVKPGAFIHVLRLAS